MAFLDNAQMHFSLNYYNIIGSKFENHHKNGEHNFYGATNDYGKNFLVFLPTFAYTTPLTENSYVGIAAYTDFAALYGWNGNYAKSLADKMDIRGGTVALSYAYKFNPGLSFGASITANYSRLKFALEKDNAQNPNYVKAIGSNSNKPTWIDKNGNIRDTYWAYGGKVDTHNDIEYGYKLALTYAPEKFDEKLRMSLVYNSRYESEFSGDMEFRISKFALSDFLLKHANNSNTNDGIKLIDQLLKTNPALINEDMLGVLGIVASSGILSTDVYANNGDRLPSQDDLIKYNGSAKASFLYPESINFGMAYENGKHEFMFNVGRTFWSKYKRLDIEVDIPKLPDSLGQLTLSLIGYCMQPNSACSNMEEMIKVIRQLATNVSGEEKQKIEEYILASILNQSMEQKWKDTTLISLGYRYNYDDKWSFMAGFATEDSPVRREEISFLAKDSRMYMYSLGVEYRYSKNLIFNLSAMHQKYANVNVRDVDNDLLLTSGNFKKQSNQIINFGFSYIF